jgi:6,7-dimethyl-8-ribityllumazine synthase
MAGAEEAPLDPVTLSAFAGRVGSVIEGDRDGRGLRVGVACARFNGAITARLLDGVVQGLEECRVARADIVVAWVPGAFELPLLAQRLLSAPRPVDAVIALGAVIRGETGHYEFVAGECARGLQDVQLAASAPVVFGVLTTESLAQALARSEPDETNKGRESALTAVETVTLARRAPLGG